MERIKIRTRIICWIKNLFGFTTQSKLQKLIGNLTYRSESSVDALWHVLPKGSIVSGGYVEQGFDEFMDICLRGQPLALAYLKFRRALTDNLTGLRVLRYSVNVGIYNTAIEIVGRDCCGNLVIVQTSATET